MSGKKENAEKELKQWRRALEERGLKVSRKKTEYIAFNEESEGTI